MKTLNDLLTTYGPGLLAALIAGLPSLYTALTKMPDADKEGTFTNKLVKWFKVGMQVVSFLTHKDDKGTMKLPGTVRTKEADDKKDNDKAPPAPPSAVAAALLPLLFITTLASCGADWQAVKKDVINCTVQSVATKAPKLLPLILDILNNKKEVEWGPALDALKTAGGDELNCVLVAVYHDLVLQGHKASASPQTSEHAALLQKKRAFVEGFLAKNKVNVLFPFSGGN